MPSHPGTQVKKMEEWCKEMDFKVCYDNTELRKPVVFNPSGRHFVSCINFEGQHVSATGYFYAQHRAIIPKELNGLLIRIRGAAIGEYDSSFLGFSTTEASILQRWVSCEVWADDRLEVAMNIDRRTLREIHPAVVELRTFLHKELRKVLKDARSKLYEEGGLREEKK